MIEVSSVSKHYQNEPVLKDITFHVEQGHTACVIGQNGSGKSTLFSILAGLLQPDTGTVKVGGLPPGKKAIGFVPQQDYLFSQLTVKDNISFWAAAAGFSFSSLQVQESMELFHITSFLDKKIVHLSGGMKRRVALCTALLHNPDVLLLDEPFSGLDILHKEEIGSYLNRLREDGKTILYSTHNTDEIHLLASDLFVIFNGSIHRVGLSNHLDEINATVTQYLKGAFDYEK